MEYSTKSNQTSKTIFLVVDTMESPYGSQVLAAMLAQGLIHRGHKIHLFTSYCSRRRSAWRSFMDKLGIEVHHPSFWFLTRHHAPHRVCAMMLRRAVGKYRPALV